MPVQIINEPAITPAQDAAIRDLLCLCFPADRAVFSQTRAWNGSAPAFSAFLEQDSGNGRGVQIIAHLGVVDRTITAGPTPVRIAGIQNVAVHPDHRGQHLTAQTMALAMKHAALRNFDAGLLFCIPALEKFYTRLGWIRLSTLNVTRIHQQKETVLPPNHLCMLYPLRLQHFPPGDLHLRGDDW